VRWIRTEGDLRDLAERLRAAGEIALDTEGDSLHHYPARLALVQLAATVGPVALVDPLALRDLSPLGPVFADRGVVTVLHAGSNDLAELKARHGFAFASIFDTSIAARFLGVRALGLDAVLGTYLGVELPPSRQRDDWSRRPLTAEQETYAVADVVHLFGLKARLTDELRRIGRLAWVEEECRALAEQPTPERAADPHGYLSIRGARDLPPRGRTILRALHELRDQLARAADRPPFKILSDEILRAIAVAAPEDMAMLARIPGCTARVIARWGVPVLAAVAQARTMPDVALPVAERKIRPSASAAASRRAESLKRWRSAAAERVGLDPGVLLPNRLIGAIGDVGPRDVDTLGRIDGLRRWRLEAFGAEIVAALGSDAQP
jgi:ribonuclease D